MSEIVVVGAGLSGLVAAINLAREGRQVRVLDREKRIGGSPRLHPSVHVTPVNLPHLLDYTGVDFSEHFIPVRKFNTYVENTGYDLPVNPFNSVERGPRPSSMDTFLYALAREAGVEFEFGQRIRKLSDIPPGSIIATGLHPELVKDAKGLVTPAGGYGTCMKCEDRKDLALVYWDRYSVDYFYLGVVNGIAYGLLFGRYQKISRDMLEIACEQLEEREGIRFDSEWTEIDVASRCVPILFADGMIFSGASAAMIDGSSGFGIQAALFSGKIAAMAVSDPETAQKEFNRFNRLYSSGVAIWTIMHLLPFRFAFLRACMNNPRLFRPIGPMASQIVPGQNEVNWAGTIFEHIRPIREKR